MIKIECFIKSLIKGLGVNVHGLRTASKLMYGQYIEVGMVELAYAQDLKSCGLRP